MKSKEPKGKLKKAFNKEKVMRFLDKQGFYIVLLVCIAIIGVTAFLTSGKNNIPQGESGDKGKIEDQPTSPKGSGVDALRRIKGDDIDITIKGSTGDNKKTEGEKTEGEKTEGEKTEGEKTEGEKTEDKKTEDGVKETLSPNTPEKEPPKEKKTVAKKETSKVEMVYPVQGEVIKEHTVDSLVYSDTLKEWRTHPGVDIESLVGSEVKAALGGTVEEIIEDSLMGICIILDHGNGLKTYYANLSTGNMVTLDQKVDKGQIISGVGRTASCEILDSPHLHFEVILEGKSVDPAPYLKQ